jgi:hypothetical protein
MKNENCMQSLEEDGNLKQTKLSFKADDQILKLLNNVNSFGNIIIESGDVDIEAYKQNQAQQRVVSIPVKSVNDIMLKLKQTIKISHSDVRRCCILSNGKMVVTTYCPGEVIVLHKDGSMDFTINISSHIIRDVTCIDSNTIAVSVFSVGSNYQVCVIDLNKRSITKNINTKSDLYGITYNDGSLICCADHKGLIRIDLKDNSIIPLVRCSLPAYSYVTTNGNNTYYTNTIQDKVACCDMDGKVQWEFKDTNVLVKPSGIATDNNNNIYVIGAGSDNVVILSPDEQNCKVLLSDRDGIYLPSGIHCDRASNQLLLIKTGGDPGLLYDITTTPT